MTIKHIVISGGGPNLFTGYGVIKTLNKKNFWHLKDIKSIHCTSAGSIIALFLLLNAEWESLDDYFIKRPWENVFHISPQMIFDAYTKKGIYTTKVFNDIFHPFFKLNNISLDITIEELFEKTNIDLNIYCTDINLFNLVVINKEKYPKMSVIKAIHMSSAIAPIFSPLIVDEMCLLDGGLLSNYPISQCLEYDKDIEKDEVLGIVSSSKEKKNCITSESVISDYLFNIIYKLIDKSDSSASNMGKITHEVVYRCEERCGLTWKESLLSSEFREKMIKKGETCAEDYLSNLKQISKTVPDPE